MKKVAIFFAALWPIVKKAAKSEFHFLQKSQLRAPLAHFAQLHINDYLREPLRLAKNLSLSQVKSACASFGASHQNPDPLLQGAFLKSFHHIIFLVEKSKKKSTKEPSAPILALRTKILTPSFSMGFFKVLSSHNFFLQKKVKTFLARSLRRQFWHYAPKP